MVDGFLMQSSCARFEWSEVCFEKLNTGTLNMFACVLHTPNTRHLHFRVFSPVHYPCGTCRYGISRGKFRNGDGACLSLHLIPFMSDLL